MEYITYGNGTQIAAAYRSLGLFFTLGSINTILITLVTCGIAYALFMGGLQGLIAKLDGKDDTPPGFSGVAWVIVGVAFFSGTVIPKTTLHVYDQVTNIYTPVDDVPWLIASVSSAFNSVEEAFREKAMLSSANADDGVGLEKKLKLIYEVTSGYSPSVGYYLNRNISEYYRQCYQFSGADLDSLYYGSKDLVDSLEPGAKQGWYMGWQNKSSPEGETLSCKDAFDRIRNKLTDAGSVVNSIYKVTCDKAGFKSEDQASLVSCKELLDKAGSKVFNVDSGALLIRNAVLAGSIRDAMIEDGTTAAMKVIANQGMVGDGLASMASSADWMPVIRATFLSVIISLNTVLLPLLVTPLVGKVLKIIVGLFFFVFAWEISDIILTYMLIPNAIQNVFAGLSTGQMGLESIWTAPSATIRALTLLGEARTSTMNIASFLAASLVGLSAYGLTSWGQRMVGSLEKNADKSSDQTSPEQSGVMLRSLADSQGLMRSYAANDMDKFINASEYTSTESMVAANTTIDQLGGNAQMAASLSGQESGGASAGEVTGAMRAAADSGTSLADQSASTSDYSASTKHFDSNTATSLLGDNAGKRTGQLSGSGKAGEVLGSENTAKKDGKTLVEQGKDNAYTSSSRQGADTNAMMRVLGSDAGYLTGRTEGGETAGRTQEVIRKLGIDGGINVGKVKGGEEVGKVDAYGAGGSDVAETARMVSGFNTGKEVGEASIATAKLGATPVDAGINIGGVSGGEESGKYTGHAQSGDAATVAFGTAQHETQHNDASVARNDQLADQLQGNYKELAEIETTGTQAVINTYGTSSNAQHNADTSEQRTAGTNTGYEQVAAITNVTPQQLAEEESSDSASYAHATYQAKGGTTDEVNDFNTQTGQRNTADAYAENKLRGAIMASTGLTNEQVSLAENGSVNTTVDENGAANLYRNGLINERQFEMLNSNHGGVVSLNGSINEDGTFKTIQSSIQSGHKGDSDNSYTVNEQSTILLGANTGDNESTRQALANPSVVQELLAQPGGQLNVADKTASSLREIATFNHVDDANTQGSAGISYERRLEGKGGSNSLAGRITGTFTKSSIDSVQTDMLTAASLNTIKGLERVADQKGLVGSEKQRFVAEEYSTFYKDLIATSTDQGLQNNTSNVVDLRSHTFFASRGYDERYLSNNNKGAENQREKYGDPIVKENTDSRTPYMKSLDVFGGTGHPSAGYSPFGFTTYASGGSNAHHASTTPASSHSEQPQTVTPTADQVSTRAESTAATPASSRPEQPQTVTPAADQVSTRAESTAATPASSRPEQPQTVTPAADQVSTRAESTAATPASSRPEQPQTVTPAADQVSTRAESPASPRTAPASAANTTVVAGTQKDIAKLDTVGSQNHVEQQLPQKVVQQVNSVASTQKVVVVKEKAAPSDESAPQTSTSRANPGGDKGEITSSSDMPPIKGVQDNKNIPNG